MKFNWENPITEHNKEGIITNVHYRLTGTDEDFSADVYGCIALPEPSDEVIALKDLEKETIVSWLESILDVDALKQSIEQQIEDKKNPKSFIKIFE